MNASNQAPPNLGAMYRCNHSLQVAVSTGWTVRLYHNQSDPNAEAKLLKHILSAGSHIDICNVTEIIQNRNLSNNLNAMTWRWVAHDSYCCESFPPSQPFPTQRKDGLFVGWRAVPSEKLQFPCPSQCRPVNGTSDWIFC
uniref:Uncharacterized protein n=1 Tax=Daphnia galeata TaxID=27404 RepID=A0A8J2S0V3_9CRUS|nr:unnamed protein product [Daphnia galeata]